MTSIRFALLVSAVTVAVTNMPAAAQPIQVPIPQTAAQVPGPVLGTGMTRDYVQMVGRAAYFWGYPLVATINRRAAFAKAPERILLGGAVPMAPVGFNTMLNDYIKPDQTFIVCPNQDVVYGGGFTALDKSRRCSKCRTLATVFGSIHYTTRAPMKLPELASNTAASPAST
jgi:hypothetical protein